MPRGGKRQGSAGKSYQNRSDLNTAPHRLPVTTVPGQPYGSQTQQAQDQAAVPMASGDVSQGTGSPMDPQDAQSQADQFNPPPVVPLGAPSQMPDQHVMTPPSNPMPGQSDPLLNGVAILNALGSSASPEVKALRSVVSAAQANAAAP